MRFIGSKERLTPAIGKVLSQNGIALGSTVGDLFCGTGSVSALFKQNGYRVIANDNLYFCTIMAQAKLKISVEPTFSSLGNVLQREPSRQPKLFTSQYEQVLDFLNTLPPEEGFIYRNYSPEGTRGGPYLRSYFTGGNAGRIDAIRSRIEEWHAIGAITADERSLLLTDLVVATAAVSNTAGTYGFFLKDFEARALKPLNMRPSTIIPGRVDHAIYNMDANEIAGKVTLDLAYLDPPYNWRQYAAYYHIVETVAQYDCPPLKGKSGLRPWQTQRSRYSDRKGARSALREIVNAVDAKAILLSYNAEGLIAHDEIMNILREVGEPQFHTLAIPRYVSSRGGTDNHIVQERLYYVRVKR